MKSSAIVKFLGSAFAYLKSGTVFKVISVTSRVALGIVSTLKLQARRILRWWHGDEEFRTISAARDEAFANEGRRTPHFHRTTQYLLAIPAVILVIAVAASLEQTPVTGRWRIIMMNKDEEALLVESFLKPGSPPGSHLNWTVPRDWVAILRSDQNPHVQNGVPSNTIMGYPVLNPSDDWRAKWVLNTLIRLQDSVQRLNIIPGSPADRYDKLDVGDTRFLIPPVAIPLTIRPAVLKHHGRSEDEYIEGPFLTRYGCVVLNSPIANAFAIGFGPALQTNPDGVEEAPGVIVVHSGLLDEIMKGRRQRVVEASGESVAVNPVASPNPVVGIFSNLVKPYSPIVAAPSKREDEELAAVLAHELSHALLSHTLEAESAGNMYDLLTTILADCKLLFSVYPI